MASRRGPARSTAATKGRQKAANGTTATNGADTDKRRGGAPALVEVVLARQMVLHQQPVALDPLGEDLADQLVLGLRRVHLAAAGNATTGQMKGPDFKPTRS